LSDAVLVMLLVLLVCSLLIPSFFNASNVLIVSDVCEQRRDALWLTARITQQRQFDSVTLSWSIGLGEFRLRTDHRRQACASFRRPLATSKRTLSSATSFFFSSFFIPSSS
jgi:hypothetical protein